MEIRQAKPSDVDNLVNFYSNYDKKHAKKRMECYTTYNSTVIALDGNKIVGALQYYIKEDPATGMAEFEEVFVSEKSRGKGIGKKIVLAGIEYVKKYFLDNKIKPRRIYLFVDETNKAARNLYEKCGFRRIADVGDIFNENANELFYCLKF